MGEVYDLIEKNLKLKPNKFCISNEVELGGSIITVVKAQNEDLIFKTTTGKRISAIEELIKPTCRKE